jgi:hypothetical protein
VVRGLESEVAEFLAAEEPLGVAARRLQVLYQRGSAGGDEHHRQRRLVLVLGLDERAEQRPMRVVVLARLVVQCVCAS